MPPPEVVEVWPPKSPQLFHQKPPKAQLKKAKAAAAAASPPPPSPSKPPSMASSSSSSSAGSISSSSPPPIAPAKKSLLRRMFPFLLAVNFAVGAYVLTRTYTKPAENEAVEESPAAPVESKGATISEKEPASKTTESTPVPVKELPPVPVEEQRQLLKWILEEKRKVKASDKLEKQKIDEEKALLKHYIRAKSLPSL